MAKKAPTTKAPAKKKPAAKAASKPAGGAKPAKKAAVKEVPTKSAPKPAAKAKPEGTTAKKGSTKPATTKPATTKPAPAQTAPAKTAPAKPEPKAEAKRAPKSVKKTAKAEAEAAAMAAAKKAAEKKIADAKAADAKKNSGRKGITIVDDKPKRRQPMAKPTKLLGPPPGISLLGSKRKPLISSGPRAPESVHSTFNTGHDEEEKPKKKLKSPFGKKELDKYREILLQKRRDLVGDVSTMERGVLSLGDKTGDPATDVAEQGSDAYDQSLSIGLAEVDRKLIREIDAAIKRIDDKVYGLCELSGEPISAQRLNELPWARHSIEAARELERRGV